jgi:hypothetical protein
VWPELAPLESKVVRAKSIVKLANSPRQLTGAIGKREANYARTPSRWEDHEAICAKTKRLTYCARELADLCNHQRHASFRDLAQKCQCEVKLMNWGCAQLSTY